MLLLPARKLRQAMQFSSLGAVLRTCLKFATGARTRWINAAANLFTNRAIKRNTAHRFLRCAFHAHVVWADRHSQIGWHRAVFMCSGFSPIKRDSERCTASTALHTMFGHKIGWN